MAGWDDVAIARAFALRIDFRNTALAMAQLFLSGAIVMACLTIALFFVQFWRKTQDRLFLTFAGAFGLLMLERLLLVFLGFGHEFAPFVYLVRLTAFILIILAVIDKNRAK